MSVVFLLCLFCALPIHGVVVYVSTTGSDTTGTGSLSNPYQSIYKASDTISPGDFIQVRGGIYRGVGGGGELEIHGAPNAFVTIEPYAGELPVIDGAGINYTEGRAVFMLYKSSYVNVSGFEIKNSNQIGVDCWECNNIVISNNYIHHVSFNAIQGVGDNFIIDGNEVAFAAMSNEGDTFGDGGWPGTIMCWRWPDHTKSYNWIIRNNYIHDCWGEGIIGDFDGGIIQNNIVRDTFSVNIYLDGGLGASNLLVDSNFLYSSNKTYYRHGAPASGIEFSTETYPFPTFPVRNVIISNNVIVHTSYGFSYWHDPQNVNTTSNTYQNISFIYNVIWEPFVAAIKIDNIPAAYEQPSNCNIWNNIILNNSCTIGNTGVWTFSHNNWVDGIPAVANEKFSFSANPDFLAPTSYYGPNGFKLSKNSTSIARGVPTSLVKTDFWGNERSSTAPTVGIWEP